MPYLPGEAEFCGNCGTKLPDQSKVTNYIARVDSAPRPYSALRFVSAMVIVGGWMFIFFGWVVSLLWMALLNSEVQGADAPQFLFALPDYFALIYAFGNTLLGLIIIGVGQVYMVILDIRDDTNATMQYVRYALKRSQEK